jgi:alpha-ribazole phosphatase
MPNYAAMAKMAGAPQMTITSPLQRCTGTLERLVEYGFAPGEIITSAAIIEQDFGLLEGTPYDQTRFPDNPDEIAVWRPPGGESFADVVARVREFFGQLMADHAGKTICILSHAGVIRAALAIALDLPLGRGLNFTIAPLSMTATRRTADNAWQIDHINHLGDPS